MWGLPSLAGGPRGQGKNSWSMSHLPHLPVRPWPRPPGKDKKGEKGQTRGLVALRKAPCHCPSSPVPAYYLSTGAGVSAVRLMDTGPHAEATTRSPGPAGGPGEGGASAPGLSQGPQVEGHAYAGRRGRAGGGPALLSSGQARSSRNTTPKGERREFWQTLPIGKKHAFRAHISILLSCTLETVLCGHRAVALPLVLEQICNSKSEYVHYQRLLCCAK